MYSSQFRCQMEIYWDLKPPVICNGCKYIQPYYKRSSQQPEAAKRTAPESMSSNWNGKARNPERIAGCQVEEASQPHRNRIWPKSHAGSSTHNVIHYSRAVSRTISGKEKLYAVLLTAAERDCKRWYREKGKPKRPAKGQRGFEWRQTWLSKHNIFGRETQKRLKIQQKYTSRTLWGS